MAQLDVQLASVSGNSRKASTQHKVTDMTTNQPIESSRYCSVTAQSFEGPQDVEVSSLKEARSRPAKFVLRFVPLA